LHTSFLLLDGVRVYVCRVVYACFHSLMYISCRLTPHIRMAST
jgi:hypothetical protein